ncbi:MAG: hypothetical protein KAT70_08380, partial [Thermoplasmata archaeon]|nr:hypothetical protein [Thermoplasmata archaeon]
KRWGPFVVAWFSERALGVEESEWFSRWDLFCNDFSRSIPLSSLYLLLGKLTADGILEVKVSSGKHFFRLKTGSLGLLGSLSNVISQEGNIERVGGLVRETTPLRAKTSVVEASRQEMGQI